MHLEPMIPEKRQYRTLYLFSIDRLCHRKQYHVVMTDIQAVRTSVSLPQDSGAKKGRSYRLSYVTDSNICTLPCQYAREASIYEQIIGMRVPYSPKKSERKNAPYLLFTFKYSINKFMFFNKFRRILQQRWIRIISRTLAYLIWMGIQ